MSGCVPRAFLSRIVRPLAACDEASARNLLFTGADELVETFELAAPGNELEADSRAQLKRISVRASVAGGILVARTAVCRASFHCANCVPQWVFR